MLKFCYAKQSGIDTFWGQLDHNTAVIKPSVVPCTFTSVPHLHHGQDFHILRLKLECPNTHISCMLPRYKFNIHPKGPRTQMQGIYTKQ